MPKVGIVMGSDSDMKVMSKAADMLEKFGIEYEMTIISAHREPDVFYEYAKSAEAKDFKVIIAGAGMAAHLPGMCAAIFPMPVIGVPMSGKNLEGMDALYSIVQMPPGIPVASPSHSISRRFHPFRLHIYLRAVHPLWNLQFPIQISVSFFSTNHTHLYARFWNGNAVFLYIRVESKAFAFIKTVSVRKLQSK